DSFRAFDERLRLLVVRGVLFAHPFGEQPQRVVPERVDLDGLASARRDYPIADLRVHPGELVARGALAEQPVALVDAYAEARAMNVTAHDGAQDRENQSQGLAVASRLEVAVERVKEPERRVGRMIAPLPFAFGEQVRDQSVAHVMREGPKDPTGLGQPPRGERQPFEADHGIAPPVGEPVVAGDHRANLVTGGARPRGLFDAPGGDEDELARRPRHFPGAASLRRGRGRRQPPPAALYLRRQRRARRERVYRRLRFGRSDQRDVTGVQQGAAEIARTPQDALRVVAAPRLHTIEEVFDDATVERQ